MKNTNHNHFFLPPQNKTFKKKTNFFISESQDIKSQLYNRKSQLRVIKAELRDINSLL